MVIFRIYMFLINNKLHWKKKRKNKGKNLEFDGPSWCQKSWQRKIVSPCPTENFIKVLAVFLRPRILFHPHVLSCGTLNCPNAYCSKNIKLYPFNHDRACLSKEIPYLSHNCSCVILLFHLPQTARTKLELNWIKKQRRTLENWSFWP